MLLAIRFFEPLFGALIVVPFFGLPPWLLRFKLFSDCLPGYFVSNFTPCGANTPKGIKNGIAARKTTAMPFAHKNTSYRTAVFFTALQDLAVKSYIA